MWGKDTGLTENRIWSQIAEDLGSDALKQIVGQRNLLWIRASRHSGVSGPVHRLPLHACAYRTILNTPVPFEDDQPRFQKFGKQGVYSCFTTPENHPNEQYASLESWPRIPTRPFSSIVVCPINGYFPVPQRVVLAEAECGLPVASLQVLNQNTRDIKYNFTVCLHKPLFEVGLKDVPRLLEWIAVNRVFGGEHFVIYTLPSTDEIRKYLQPLVASGLLEIHLFDMVVPAKEKNEYHNQKVAINECMYRHMYTSKRLVMIDFDEFPTPHSKDNWQDLINTSPCAKESTVYFRNRFFPMQLTGINVSRSDILVTALEKNLQSNESFKCPVRSKVIINPRHVHICTVHYVHKYIRGITRTRKCCMPEDLGHLHHYRTWGEFTQEKTTAADGLVTDHRMWHFESKIIESVREVYKIQNMTAAKAAWCSHGNCVEV
ncbi:hypothetical protein CAPTEDRAFT_214566 [Capitella teleta]|uniref:Glycosyltransferase family 92 protein n=1 Tax=Capitella teleta TaxID=283909 RepID=R7T4B7_CAPTE|nr:hypothetical protein CAPTEDRAFT_214566 [Capitella teleta]|eukprot:ELT87708.1 hypothetical protein CAPTEDRAFT_214566 [Capitella teleta]